MKLIKRAGSWHLKHGENFASLGVGHNPKTGGIATVRQLRIMEPERIADTTALLTREGTKDPYAFKP